MQPHDDVRAQISTSSHVYALLARLWLKEVDSRLIRQLHQAELAKAFLQVGGVLPEDSQCESLAAEYCQLFVGPQNHLPPYQSVWETGQLQSEVTTSIQQFADLLRYRLHHQYARTMLDHLGNQLEIMARATSSECRQASPQVADEVAAEFFKRHLCWPDRLLKEALRRSHSQFYRAIIELTSNFLDAEREHWRTWPTPSASHADV
ncbi:MAG: molecular chaperone TorD family protein [Pirellulales bacterium]|nr:molecular chaperone TorD family protein [Pirellulales bacterium]